MNKHLVCLCISLCWSSLAFADAMPSCPPGQKMVTNPVAEGARHHSGGHCEDNPSYKPPKETTPKLSPEAEKASQAMAIAQATALELKAAAAQARAQAEEAKMKAMSAKGTPDEATLQKTADELTKKADELDKQSLTADEAAKKAAEDAKKLSTAQPQNNTTTESNPPEKGDSTPKTNAEKKSGGCAVDPIAGSSWWALLAGLALLWRRRKTQ